MDMATFRALVKILSLENYYNAKIAGLSKKFYPIKIYNYVYAVMQCLVYILYGLHPLQVQKLMNKECGMGVWEFNLRDVLRWCELSQVYIH